MNKNANGISNRGISFDKADAVLALSIDQASEKIIIIYNKIGKITGRFTEKFSFLKVKIATNKKMASAILLTANDNGIVNKTRSKGIKELWFLFSFSRFCHTFFKEL